MADLELFPRLLQRFADAMKAAQSGAESAWQYFQDLGAEASADNRKRLLRSLESEKRQARAGRVRARRESSRD
jgi:hypothetical protein